MATRFEALTVVLAEVRKMIGGAKEVKEVIVILAKDAAILKEVAAILEEAVAISKEAVAISEEAVATLKAVAATDETFTPTWTAALNEITA